MDIDAPPTGNEQKWNDQDTKKAYKDAKMILYILLIWVFLGITAFIMSLVCFGRSGSTSDKVIGFLLAVFFGPFYWLYFAFNKGYCKRV